VLMARAQFWKYDKRSNEWEPKDCPKELSENIGDQRAWATFRTLKAITSVPILRPDLSVWTQPGYDDATGVYYQPTIQFPTIIPEPTRDDALQALARLREPFDQFPYESPEAEAVFISHVVASVVRASFSTSPIYLYTSPMAATGKTLLADIAAVIAQGVAHPAKNPYSEGEELRKVLFASLLAGDAALTLDNVPNGMKIRAPGLCQVATSGMYGDRVLGASETRKLPNRSTVVLNGNNITPAGDMSRRSVICRLDVNAESARGRTFRIKDLRAHVRERRAQYIVDVLTLVRAYAFAGRPEVAHPLESFEEWSRLARDPLVWLGMADPVASQLTQSEDDVTPLRTAFGAIVAATVAQEYTFTTAQLAGLMTNLSPAIIVSGAPNKLRESMVNAGCTEPGDARKLGYWLREYKDRVAGGWKLIGEVDKVTKLASWRMRGAA
jgi:putative DNA primase/helicase